MGINAVAKSDLIKKVKWTHVQCPVCGLSATRGKLDAGPYDVCMVRWMGLGRGKGFQKAMATLMDRPVVLEWVRDCLVAALAHVDAAIAKRSV